jgi:hypothetical protein
MNIQLPVQFIKLTKNLGGEVWIDPTRIIYMDVGTSKDVTASKEPSDKDTKKKQEPPTPASMTILHVSGAKKELFVKETPEEINKAIRSQTYHFEMAFKGK